MPTNSYHIRWQVLQLKPYKFRIVSLDFQQMIKLRNFLCHMGTPLEGRPENLPRSLPTQGRVTPNWVTTDTSTPFPDRKRPFSRDPESQQPQSNKFAVTT